jgi:hypothetical protein
MPKVKRKNSIMQGKHTAPTSGQYTMPARGKGYIHATPFMASPTPPGRVTVDDATWDKVMMEVMEEYDEAWTQLADK